MAILSVNAGSSSLKFAIYPNKDHSVLPCMLSGNFQGLEPGGTAQLQYKIKGQAFNLLLEHAEQDPFLSALTALKKLLLSLPDLPPITAVSHRIVHGGAAHDQSVVATPEILRELEKLNSLAPLHQPHNLDGVKAFEKVFPNMPQILCFDTAFHRTVPPLESAFALPKALTDQHIRKYGFHGLSYQFIMSQLLVHSKKARQRVLMAHLGNGASLCAAKEAQSLATTMGFSALDGLMMGTRAGSLDAGVLLYLMEQGYTHDQLETLLYKKSGLLGVSTLSADMRTLRDSNSPLAKTAIDLFTHRIVRETGAMTACMGGLDVIAFSGGIGENDRVLRKEVCAKLSWLNISIDESLNASAASQSVARISSQDSAVEVWVIQTDEGMVAAKDAIALLDKSENQLE